MNPYNSEDLETFADYGRLVCELRNLRFGQSLRENGSIIVTWTSAGNDHRIKDFDEDDFRSFLLGCRMLLQRNDRLSMENVWNIAVDIPDDTEGRWLARLNKARTPYLLHAMNTVPFRDQDGESYTYEEVVKVFLYGTYAHSDEKKRAILRKWEQSPKTLIFMKQNFVLSMKLLLDRAELLALEIQTALRTSDFYGAE